MELDIFNIASLIGSMAFALSGFLIGVRKELDIMGLFIVSMLTANGGGAVRDVLVGETPNVLTDPFAFYLVLGCVFISFAIKLHKYAGLERRNIFLLSDSVGLVAFSITGALVGVAAGLSIFGVMVLSFITATGGGIIRDMIVNEVPAVFSEGFYGSVALIIGAAIYVLNIYDLNNNITISIVFVAGLLIRLLAHFQDWHLPKVQKGAPFLDDGEGQ